MILIISSHIVVAVPSDAFRRAIHSIAIEDGRFKQELFASTKQTRFSISSLGIFFCIQLLHEIFIILLKLGLHFLRHVVNNRTLRVVKHGVVKGQMDVSLKLFQRMVTIVLQFLPNRPKIHRLFDDFKIVWKTQLDWIDRTVEYPAMLMALQDLQHLETLGFELLGWELQTLVQGCNMRLNLLDRKTIDECMIFLRLGSRKLGSDNLPVCELHPRSCCNHRLSWNCCRGHRWLLRKRLLLREIRRI
mmetsp:Transcript_11684/g.18750  ORF Transcript_11684/g.18750 Transcript_11684/m.18750 type:complete len:246 (-) Transcript_11684:1103-1840(-)